jgi:hypothetical protein
LADFAYSIENPEPGDQNYFALIGRGATAPPKCYRFDPEQRSKAMELTDLLKKVGQQDGILEEDAPKPTPALRIRPSF